MTFFFRNGTTVFIYSEKYVASVFLIFLLLFFVMIISNDKQI